VHELCAGRDHIRVEVPASLFLGLIKDYLIFPVRLDFRLAKLLLFSVLRCAESTRSLLVLLGSGSHTIYSQVENFLWLHDLDDFVGVGIDIVKDLLLALWLRATILRVCTRMYNTVHVEVEIVNLWIILLYFLLQTLFFLPGPILCCSDTQGLVIVSLLFITKVDLVGIRGLLFSLLFFRELFRVHLQIVL